MSEHKIYKDRARIATLKSSRLILLIIFKTSQRSRTPFSPTAADHRMAHPGLAGC